MVTMFQNKQNKIASILFCFDSNIVFKSDSFLGKKKISLDSIHSTQLCGRTYFRWNF